MDRMEQNLLSTGLPALDKELEGGLFSGSLVYMRVDPSAMAELFLYHFLQQKPTYYVNTERKPEFIIHNMENAGFDFSIEKKTYKTMRHDKEGGI
ncbi:Uncharacterised protein [uncultured archaeon]|nr:Uncharacterised protein [uncultured archaeon]